MPYNRPDSVTTLISLPQGLNRLAMDLAKKQGLTKADVIALCVQFCLGENPDQLPQGSVSPPLRFPNRLMRD